MKHGVQDSLKTFPQNKYIVTQLRKQKASGRARVEAMVDQRSNMCDKHGKEMNMFCKEEVCQKAICHLCLVKFHKFHDIVDSEEHRREKHQSLVSKIDSFTKTLEATRDTLLKTEQEVERQFNTALNDLKVTQTNVVKRIDEEFAKSPMTKNYSN